ncbi:cytochrome P450 [Mycena vulgaris]|nr:cytochrome P450 [Mycena vulgaris]
MPLWLPLVVAPVLLLVTTFLRRTATPLPPGPRRKPLIDNLLDVPLTNPWAIFEIWRRKYGDVVYLEVFGNSIVVLNSIDAVVDLSERRAWNYSHPPVFTMSGELMGLDRAIGLNNRDKVWRQQRKLAAMILGPLGIKQYIPLQERLAVLLLSELQEQPEHFAALIKLAAARLIFEITYGLPVENMDNPYTKEAEKTFELVSQSIQYGSYALDFLPWLKYIPAWIPFSPAGIGARGRAVIEATVDRPLQHADGTAKPSLVSHLLSNETEVDGLDFGDVLKWTAGTMYGAGGEATAATLTTFFLAMATHPDVQKKGAEQVGFAFETYKATDNGRPLRPSICERYNQRDIAMACSSTTSGIAGEGDYLTGFAPEKHLNEDAADVRPVDPRAYAFGFGRRACPGQYLAEDSLFIFAASILTAFRITPRLIPRAKRHLSSQNLILDSSGEYNSASYAAWAEREYSHPELFECRILARTPETKKLIANQLLAVATE